MRLHQFDDDLPGELLIDDVEFCKCMKNTFGFRGPQRVLMEVFRTMDSDGSGQIGFVSGSWARP